MSGVFQTNNTCFPKLMRHAADWLKLLQIYLTASYGKTEFLANYYPQKFIFHYGEYSVMIRIVNIIVYYILDSLFKSPTTLTSRLHPLFFGHKTIHLKQYTVVGRLRWIHTVKVYHNFKAQFSITFFRLTPSYPRKVSFRAKTYLHMRK